MPTGKRASMREGPLAALFRKTAEDTGAPGAPGGDAAPDQPSEATPRRPASVRSRASGLRCRPHVEPPRPARQPPRPAAAPAPPAALRTRAARHRSERARAPDPLPAGAPAPRVLSGHPGELDGSPAASEPSRAAVARAPPPGPEPDVYARSERSAEAFGVARPVGTPVLRVVGVGGAGVNAINRMVEAEIEGVEFLAINTDLQSLQQSAAHETLHIGDAITRGLGSGSNPDLGRQAAREEYDRIKALLRGSDMVFIAAGAGGGTGTGAAPIVAKIARELGALTVGIVTRPFQFEGTRRRDQAEVGIDALAAEVDTLIVVPNNRLLSVLDRNTSMVDAFRVADDVLRQGVQGISDLVTLPG